MRTPHDLPAAGSLLRWCGLLFVVLAIVGGILGMHGLNGAPGASMGHGGPGSTAHTIGGMAIQPALPSVHAAPESCRPAGAAALGLAGAPAGAACSPAECAGAMPMHGACIPAPASPVPNVPLPGILATHAPGARYAVVPGHKSADRSPDPPSLSKLSISRT